MTKNVPYGSFFSKSLPYSYQVSDAVGSTKNNSPDLIIPIDTKKSSISYFLKEQEAPIDKFEKFAMEQVAQESQKRKTPPTSSPPNKVKSMKITNFFDKKK